MKNNFLIFVVAMFCVVWVSPVMATGNPYKNAGMVTAVDVPVTIVSDTVTMTDTSVVILDGANYQHTIGRVSIFMKPLMEGLNEKISTEANTRVIGDSNVVKYEFYKDLIKEHVLLNSPETISYSYDIGLTDWVTSEPDLTKPQVTLDGNNTPIVTYPNTKEVINYARDSITSIGIDPWGNLVFYVNGADVAVLPKPFAIDATGRRFDLDFVLDRSAKTITISGDMSGAQYPVVVDPSERVTNGGFETGTTDGWTPDAYEGGPPPTLTITSAGGAYEGTYYCLYEGNYGDGVTGYSRMYQMIDYTGVTSVSAAVKIFEYNRWDFVVSDSWWLEASDGTLNYGIDFPGQVPTGWVVMSATPTLSGSHPIQVWTYLTNRAGIDSISATGTVTPPTPAQFLYVTDGGVLPSHPEIHINYTVYVTVFNPNLQNVPKRISVTEEILKEGYDDTVFINPPSDGYLQEIPQQSQRDYRFTYARHQNPFKPLEQVLATDGAMAIMNAGIKSIWPLIPKNTPLKMENIHSASEQFAAEMGCRFETWYRYWFHTDGVIIKSPDGIEHNLDGQYMDVTVMAPMYKRLALGNAMYTQIIGTGASVYSVLAERHVDLPIITEITTLGQLTNPASLLLAFGEFDLALISETMIKKALDPDPNYMEPVVVENYHIAELDQIPNSPLKDFILVFDRAVPHARASTDAYIKYATARDANDQNWQTRLLKEVYKYDSMYGDDLIDLKTKSGPAMEYLKKHGLNPTSEKINAAKQEIHNNGLPESEVILFKRYGYSDKDIENVRQTVLETPDSYIANYSETIPQGFDELIAFNDAMLSNLTPVLGIEAPPYANFTTSTTTGKAPLSVQFSDASLRSPDQWLWEFGDDQTASTQNAEHTYTTAGTYTVKLTAINSGTGSDTRTKYDYITVSADPVALVDNLIQYINSQNINKVAKKIYIDQLIRVKTSLTTNKPGDAIIQLKAFQLTVQIAQGRVLTPEQASTIQDSATAIIAATNVPVNQQAIDMTKALKAYVKDLGLPKLTQGVLVLELEGAQLNLEAGKDKEALDHFTIFMKTVKSQDGKAIPHDMAVQLIAKAQDIVNVMQ